MTRTVYDGRGAGEQEVGWRGKGGGESQVDHVTDALNIIFKTSKSRVEIDPPACNTRKRTYAC